MTKLHWLQWSFLHSPRLSPPPMSTLLCPRRVIYVALFAPSRISWTRGSKPRAEKAAVSFNLATPPLSAVLPFPSSILTMSGRLREATIIRGVVPFSFSRSMLHSASTSNLTRLLQFPQTACMRGVFPLPPCASLSAPASSS